MNNEYEFSKVAGALARLEEEEKDVPSKTGPLLKGYMEQAYPLKGMPEDTYLSLLRSGMFWEWYPEATGVFLTDTK